MPTDFYSKDYHQTNATADSTRICKNYSSSAKTDGVAMTPDMAETYYSHLMEWAV